MTKLANKELSSNEEEEGPSVRSRSQKRIINTQSLLREMRKPLAQMIKKDET